MRHKAMKRKDPVEKELQTATAREMGEGADASGRMPGEVRGKGQVPSKEDEDADKTVVMVRDGNEMDVAKRDVESHKRQGFALKEEVTE